MVEEEKILRELAQLRTEHTQLSKQLKNLTSQASFDQLLAQRIKKRKLWIKDRISILQELIYDDIIA